MGLWRQEVCRYVEHKVLQRCNGEGPRVIPNLECGDYFGILLSSWRSFCRTNTRQPKVWFLPSSFHIWFQKNHHPGKVVIWMYTAYLIAYGQKANCMTYGHPAHAWGSYFQAHSWMSLTACWAITFWKWAFPPQWVRCCLFCMKALSEKQLLSLW